MSILKITITGETEFTIVQDDIDRWAKVSFVTTSPKIGTVLIEDLVRAIQIDLFPLLATFESSEVACRVNVFGDFLCNGSTFKLPVHFLLNEDENIEIRGPLA